MARCEKTHLHLSPLLSSVDGLVRRTLRVPHTVDLSFVMGSISENLAHHCYSILLFLFELQSKEDQSHFFLKFSELIQGLILKTLE